MNFDELNEFIPYLVGEKLHTTTTKIGHGVVVTGPGRHQGDTHRPGGDFLVLVTDKSIGWKRHPFTHDDIFDDVYCKTQENPVAADKLMTDYSRVIFGADPADFDKVAYKWENSLSAPTFLRAVQALGVAEHRRYRQHEPRGGGRYLPCRFASGIIEGIWTPSQAKAVQRRGRPGLDRLIQAHGAPTPLKARL